MGLPQLEQYIAPALRGLPHFLQNLSCENPGSTFDELLRKKGREEKQGERSEKSQVTEC